MKKIAFVCTGNTCRSPMAAALARKALKENQMNIEVLSRGIAVSFPAEAHKNAIKTMGRYELDISDHRATQLGKNDLKDIDLILTMTNQHKQFVLMGYPEMGDRVFTLKEFIEENDLDIQDPYGGNEQVYERCAADLQRYIERLIEKIKKYDQI